MSVNPINPGDHVYCARCECDHLIWEDCPNDVEPVDVEPAEEDEALLISLPSFVHSTTTSWKETNLMNNDPIIANDLLSPLPVVFTYDLRSFSFFHCINMILRTAQLMDETERQMALLALGDDAGAMVFDCLAQDSSRAHFTSRLRNAIHYNNCATKDIANRHSATLRAARLMVVKVETMVIRNGMPTYNKPGYYVPKGEVNGRFYSRTLTGASRYATLSGAMSAARSRMTDHADRFFPMATYS